MNNSRRQPLRQQVPCRDVPARHIVQPDRHLALIGAIGAPDHEGRVTRGRVLDRRGLVRLPDQQQSVVPAAVNQPVELNVAIGDHA